ncbi:MAG TPA: hypothetical protein PLZ15_09220 [Melioribacteraceae bacterium]|nr:hypothetical protein [Melioribacteraceae bacterium]
MSQYLKDKLESLMKRYYKEMQGAARLEKSHKELGHYTDEHIASLMKDEHEKIKNKFLTEAKSLLSEIRKNVHDFQPLKLKSLFPNLTKDSDSFGQFKMSGELQISDGNRRAQEFLLNDSPMKYDQLVDELNEASLLGRVDYASQVLNKLQPVFDQLDSQFELKHGEQKLFDFRNNHFKKTGAQEFIDKIDSSNVIEENTKLFVSEVWHGSDFIFIPDKDSKNGTDNLLRAQLEERLSTAPKELLS